jgi:hypothetical protein
MIFFKYFIVVEELDAKRLSRIDAKREQLLQLSETNRALRRIRKEGWCNENILEH